MKEYASKDVKIGGYYWAELGRNNLKTYAGQKTTFIRERVQVLGIDGENIKIKTVSPIRREIETSVTILFN